MAFLDNLDPSYPGTPPFMGDPNDPRRRAAAIAGRMMPPPGVNIAPPDLPPPPSMAPIGSDQPSPTTMGLIAALRGQALPQPPAPPEPPPDMSVWQQYLGAAQPPPVRQIQPAHGFLGKLGQHLRYMGEGMAAGAAGGPSGTQDPANMLGRLIGGGVGGAVNPQFAQNLGYRNVQLPQWYAQQAQQQQMMGNRLGMAERIGALTGVNPVTGQPTYQATRDEQKSDMQDAMLQYKRETDAKHLELQREVAEGRKSAQDAALEFRQSQAESLNRLRDLELQLKQYTGQRNLDLRERGLADRENQGPKYKSYVFDNKPVEEWTAQQKAAYSQIDQGPGSDTRKNMMKQDWLKANPKPKAERIGEVEGQQPSSGTAGARTTGGAKIATQAQVQQFAQQHGISIEDAMKQVQAEGYQVK